MFKDYLFFSNNLQDAARQILEAQEAKAKQYLLEYDANARKPMPGYTYDGQEPELRSDEDAEKTKEWYTNVVNPRLGSSDMQAYQSEVDLYGRPTGHASVKLLRVPTEKPTDRSKNKPKEEVEPEIITQKYEPDPEIQKLLHRMKYLPVPTKDDLEMARRVFEDERSVRDERTEKKIREIAAMTDMDPEKLIQRLMYYPGSKKFTVPPRNGRDLTPIGSLKGKPPTDKNSI